MRNIAIAFLLILNINILSAQEINTVKSDKLIPARWICHPTASAKAYGIYHFRLTVNLTDIPEKVVVNVTADNRYRLFINGKNAGYGPARGDLKNWYYDSINIAPFLKEGENTFAAVVWNMGEHAPFAQFSLQTGFLLWSDDEVLKSINTDKSWKVIQNEAYEPLSVQVRGFYAAGACDKIDGSKYPWQWEQPNYDDSKWLNAKVISHSAVRKGYMYGSGWPLVPRTIPMMEETPEKVFVIRKVGNLDLKENQLNFNGPIAVKANDTVSLYLDQGYLTTGYPYLNISGGKNAKISTMYLEAPYVNEKWSKNTHYTRKDDRNIIEGKFFEGTKDEFISDGGENKTYSPLWMRCWRYVKIDITTADEPLLINNYYGVFSAYPFEDKASFKTNNNSLQDIWNVAWRTARLCAGETYFDCPYYEQLQYVGDTRIQALISLYVTGDDRLMKQAIAHYNNSRFSEGLTYSRYPSDIQQVIPPFSLYWISMVYDHWMHVGDEEFIPQFLNGIDGVLKWYEQYIDETGMTGNFDNYWFFTDWANEFTSGVPKGAHTGHNATIALHYVYALQHASILMKYFGELEKSKKYSKLANDIKAAVMKNCYNSDKRLIAQTPDQESYSQHSNIMGVLTDAISPDKQKETIEKIIADTSLIQSTIYYKFYLFQAIHKVGLANEYLNQLQPWHTMLSDNLTTFAETDFMTRSDCHAWSASPMYDFLATVCGIKPLEPGFKSFTMAPAFGNLESIDASMPTPMGEIAMQLKPKGKTGVAGKITVPKNTECKFMWYGEVTNFMAGTHKIYLKHNAAK